MHFDLSLTDCNCNDQGHTTHTQVYACVHNSLYQYSQAGEIKDFFPLGFEIKRLEFDYNIYTRKTHSQVLNAWQASPIRNEFGADDALVDVITSYLVDANVNLIALGDAIINEPDLDTSSKDERVCILHRVCSRVVSVLGLESPAVIQAAISKDDMYDSSKYDRDVSQKRKRRYTYPDSAKSRRASL
jgi:hypothetical protein